MFSTEIFLPIYRAPYNCSKNAELQSARDIYKKINKLINNNNIVRSFLKFLDFF